MVFFFFCAIALKAQIWEIRCWMFYCYLTDEWKGVEGKLNGFGSCKVELLGHTSRIPAVIR